MPLRTALARVLTISTAVAALAAAPSLLCAPNPSKEPVRQAKAHAAPSPPELADASLTAGVYHNPYFRLEFKLPRGWGELGEKAEEDGGDSAAHALSAAKLEIPRSPGFYPLLRSAPLSQEMPQIVLIAQNVSTAPQIKTGQDFVNLLTTGLLRSGWQKVRGPELLEISGQQFWRIEVIENQSGVMEGLVFSVRGKYALGFLLIAPDRNQLSALYRHVRAVKVDALQPAQ